MLKTWRQSQNILLRWLRRKLAVCDKSTASYRRRYSLSLRGKILRVETDIEIGFSQKWVGMACPHPLVYIYYHPDPEGKLRIRLPPFIAPAPDPEPSPPSPSSPRSMTIQQSLF